MLKRDSTLALMAEVSALKRFVISAVAQRLLAEPSPLDAYLALGDRLAREEAPPADDARGFDPVVSDLLSAETDERVIALVGELGTTLRRYLGS